MMRGRLSTERPNYRRAPLSAFHLTTTKEKKNIHAEQCEETFRTVRDNASNIGMMVNEAKTQLLCLLTNVHCSVSSNISMDGTEIRSQPTMKILGFIMDLAASMTEHVKYVIKKAAIRFWTITHLKRVGLKTEALVIIYNSLIRTVVEYAAQVYAYQLTGEQSERIKAIQRRAFKIIFGPGISYRWALELSGEKSLSDRRLEICRKFTLKTVDKPRYKHWFPLNEETTHSLRYRRKYKEELANTNRMMMSPVYGMRRILNEQ